MRLQQAAGAKPIEELYATMMAMLKGDRPRTRYVESVAGDIVGTLSRLQAALLE